mmetsp:Transcript_25505/g.48312  ORF Transcript_25505/g.48312 Transcript_25505/m.48312 type:complete len:188 (+) Transcript_25505:60-623(+)|eukprot:scaffold11843_cov152-Amphora_coffeaeformis.AAC.4
MDGCPVDGSILHRTVCIATYDGAARDCCINYSCALLTLAVAAFRSKDACAAIPDQNLKSRWVLIGALMLFSVCILQWGLCLVLGCAGISIVWCAVGGWIINERKHHQQAGNVAQPTETEDRSALDICEDVTLVAVLAVLIYYAIAEPPITTLAHFCALILGTLLSRLDRRLVLHGCQMYELGSMVKE